MPSKGVQIYTYISAPGPIEIDISVPGHSSTHRDKNVFRNECFEVDSKAIKWPFRRTGRFEFTVRRGSETLTSQFLEIDPMTGNIADKSSMDDLLKETPSIILPEVAISYGTYQSGSGRAGLPNRHQVYLVVTHNWSTWQRDVAPPGSPAEDKPFNHLVLPCPHDVGMNTLDPVHAILSNTGVAGAKLVEASIPAFRPAAPALSRLISGVSDRTAAIIAPDIIASLAITQKDTVATMCALGARYFEFRPARCHEKVIPHSPLPPERLYFQHGPIPGMAYDSFLAELVCFLQANPTEIAVLHVRWDGVPNECNRPDHDELRRCLDKALECTNGSIKIGSMDDIHHKTIGQLRREGLRILQVVNAGGVHGTYDDNANATLDGHSILQTWETQLEACRQDGKCMTVAQIQATPTNIPDVVHYSVVTADASSLTLMATKARCSALMLDWARHNLGEGRCRKDHLLVLMDDFIDGSVADVAVELSRKRLA